jgi:hypothetical protein
MSGVAESRSHLRARGGYAVTAPQRTMTKLLLVAVGAGMLLPAVASAGTLYGTVRLGTAPAAEVTLTVACPGFNRQPPAATATATTDGRGSYSLRVEAAGRCEMRAQRGNQVGAVFQVFVSNEAMRFDFTTDHAMNRVR